MKCLYEFKGFSFVGFNRDNETEREKCGRFGC